MKKKKTLIALLVFVGLGWFAYFYLGMLSVPKEPPVAVNEQPAPPSPAPSEPPCPGESFEAEMQDPYMRGIIEKGQKFTVLPNWYACHPLTNGDYVYYRYSSNRPPVVRIVRAHEGDHFELVQDPKHHSWNIKINGVLFEAAGEPYYFGGEPPPPLSLYVKPRNGIIGRNEAIVFSSRSPGDMDSGVFGLVNVVDLIGKVELKKN
jgi:hypothetical protein